MERPEDKVLEELSRHPVSHNVSWVQVEHQEPRVLWLEGRILARARDVFARADGVTGG
jgi:hypothetical protein